MLDPPDNETRPLLDALERKKRGAYGVLLLEHITLHIWRISFWCLFFAGLWMLRVPEFFGSPGRIGFALLFFAGLYRFVRTDLLSLRRPGAAEIDRRLERRNAMRTGQLAMLEDRLANPEKRSTRLLWNKAQESVLSLLPNLRAPCPRALMARHDPGGLRLMALLIFVTGLMVSGAQWPERIRDGLIPFTPTTMLSKGGKGVDFWIKPPDYTGLPQTRITGYGYFKTPIDIPEGSIVKIRLSNLLGAYFPPVLIIDGKKRPLEYLEDGIYGAELTVPPGGERLSVRQLLIPRAVLKYNFIPDKPPTIALTNPEESHEFLPNGPVRFLLSVRDDYGVTEMETNVTLDALVTEKPIGDPHTETRLVMSPAGQDFEIQPVYNLAWHTWAGLPVEFIFTARDHKGQTATLEGIPMILPVRTFRHPVAQSLIAMRKTLAWGGRDDFPHTARDLEILLSAPHLFQNNIVIFMALRAASSRLFYAYQSPFDDPVETAKAVISLLWDTALATEDGDLSLAMRNLRDARRALENALRDPEADPEEIARLMENLREQMALYLMELQKELQKRMAESGETPQITQQMLDNMLDLDNLSAMFEKMQSDLMSGDKDAAREMLAQLQNMLDMLDPSMAGPLPPDMQMMMQGVNELQELIKKQEELLAQTQEKAERQHTPENAYAPPLPSDGKTVEDWGLGDMPPMPQGSPQPAPQEHDSKEIQSGVDTQDEKAVQESLRYVLGQLMLDASEKLDEIPESMGKAEREMRGSESALERNAPSSSIPHQEKALEYLREAQDQFNRQFQQRLQQIIRLGMGGSMKYDPLGRPYDSSDKDGKNVSGEKVEIPDEAQRKRVEEILKTLRERAGELERSPEAREYFHRLLRQF